MIPVGKVSGGRLVILWEAGYELNKRFKYSKLACTFDKSDHTRLLAPDGFCAVPPPSQILCTLYPSYFWFDVVCIIKRRHVTNMNVPALASVLF